METLAAAQRRPDGAEIVKELTRLLGGIEGIGGGQPSNEQLAESLMGGSGLTDEHGNPIIEITEDLHSNLASSATGTSYSTHDIERWDDMTPEAREARQESYKQMWEMLEQEEEDLESAARSSAQAPVETRSAEETGSKPGTTGSTGTSRQNESRPLDPQKQSKTKKSVSFAGDNDPTDVNHDGGVPSSNWGDVIPAKLQGTRRIQIKSPFVKQEVVEQDPQTHLPPNKAGRVPDSDDEDINDDDEALSQDEDKSDPEEYEEGEDMDMAALQRQAALNYHEKRERLIEEAKKHGITGTTLADGANSDNPWDQEWVPLDANLASGPPKPSTSRFKSSISTNVSTMGPSQLKDYVKEGKLVEGKLVAPADSESDDGLNEKGKTVVDLLRQRAETDADGNVLPGLPPSTRQPGNLPKFDAPSRPNVITPSPSKAIPLSRPDALPHSRQPSGSLTPLSVVERSSPKLASPLSGVSTPNSNSGPSATPSKIKSPLSQPRSSSAIPPNAEMFTSSIISSPSFPFNSQATTSSGTGKPVNFNPENVMVRDVVEREPRRMIDSNASSGTRVSKFKAQRS